MVRKLKHHERKLLKKVDFVQYKHENNLREIEVIRRYHVQNREDYTKYNRLCGMVKKVSHKISALHQKDPYRITKAEQLLDRLFNMGLLNTVRNLSQCDKITASAFCRRRLPVMMVRLHMAESVKEAVQFVEQGHVRIGPNVIKDPSFLVTRAMEDFITWVDSSKIRRHVLKYNEKLDDFDLMS